MGSIFQRPSGHHLSIVSFLFLTALKLYSVILFKICATSTIIRLISIALGFDTILFVVVLGSPFPSACIPSL